MSIHSLHEILTEHPFFKDLPATDVEFISGCGRNVVFKEGARIAREGDAADQFFILRRGLVSVEINVPNRGAVTLQTLKQGDILGWSWLFPPYRWTLDARAVEEIHAVALDGKCLREKCEKDTAMGYRLTRKFAHIMTDRLHATLLQLLDLYASPRAPAAGKKKRSG